MNKIALFVVALLTLACSVSTPTAPAPTTAPTMPTEATQTPRSASTATEAVNIMYVTAPLNLRACAGTGCAVDRVLPKGAEVVTFGGYVETEDGGQWIFVRLVDEDVSGYVNIDYLAVIP
jgi:hypothetical protein